MKTAVTFVCLFIGVLGRIGAGHFAPMTSGFNKLREKEYHWKVNVTNKGKNAAVLDPRRVICKEVPQ